MGRRFGKPLSPEDLAAELEESRSEAYFTGEQNQRAIRLYESFGFKTVGTTRVTIADKEVGEDLVLVLHRTAMGENAARIEAGYAE